MSEIVTVRDIEMVTSDIRYAQRQGARQLLSNLIEIGRLLVEAKSMVPYGEWGKYLEEKVDYSQSTANNMMKLYQEYGDNQESFFDTITNSQAFGKLTYTQALALLALPAEERRDFAESHDAEKMSSREWEKAIRERDEALKERDENLKELVRLQNENERITAGMNEAAEKLETKDAEADALREQAQKAQAAEAEAKAKVEKLQTQLKKAKDSEKSAKEALAKAQENPEVPEAVMEQLRQEVAADAAKQATEEIQKELEAAEKRAQEATEQAQQAQEKLKEAQRAVQMANPDVAVFQAMYIQLQKTWNETVSAWQKLKTDETAAASCRKALTAAIDKFRSDIAK